MNNSIEFTRIVFPICLTFFLSVGISAEKLYSDVLTQLNAYNVSWNPATNTLTMVLAHQMLEVNSKIDINIYSLEGRKMKRQTYSPAFQLSKMNIDIAGIQPGTYYINLNDDRFILTKKFRIKLQNYTI